MTFQLVQISCRIFSNRTRHSVLRVTVSSMISGVAGLFGILVPLAASAQTITWNGLGFLYDNGVNSFSWANAVSSDGTVVVGFGANSSNNNEAFRWTLSTGMQGLGYIDGGGPSPFSIASAASANGAVIVGESTNSLGDYEAFRWTSAAGMQGLGFFSGAPFNSSRALGVSADGSVIVGYGRNALNYDEAARWTSAGIQGLGVLNTSVPGRYSVARGVSADGAVVVGQSLNALSQTEAFRWTSATGIEGLGFIGNGGPSPDSSAIGISADGTVVVGQSSIAGGFEAFRWTSATGMQGLGHINGGGTIFPFGLANAANSDGTVIVGQSSNAADEIEAFRWTPETGMLSIKGILTENGVNLGSWQLVDATSISANGQVIVGYGENPGGQYEGWIVRIIPPEVPGVPEQPLPPEIPPGFLIFDELSASVADMRQVIVSGLTTTQGVLADQIFIARDQCAPDKPWDETGKRFCAFATGTAEFWTNDAARGRGSAGLAMRVAPGLSVGVSTFVGRGDFDLRLGGRNQVDSYGGSLFASYAAAPEGLRLFGAITAGHLDYDITRNTQNGLTSVVSSKGKADGDTLGGLARIGWAFRVLDRATVTPFAEFAWARATISAYSEAGGPFPIAYRGRSVREVDVRLGGEVRYAVTDTFEINGAASWVHRVSGKVGKVTGELIGLFEIDSISPNLPTDWAELSVGGSYRMTDSLRLSGEVSTAIGRSNRPAAALRIGVSALF